MSQSGLTTSSMPVDVAGTITGDTGGALNQTAGNWNILAGANAGSSVSFDGSVSTLSLNFADGQDNIFFGRVSGSALPGPANVGVGTGTFQNINTGQWNTAVGFVGLNSITSGERNCSLGFQSLPSLTTGTRNVAIGYISGSAYTSSESNNVLIQNDGVTGESGKTRIGNSNTNACFIAGVTGVTVGASSLTTCDANGQLGTIAPGTSGNVATSDGTTWTSAALSLPSQLMVATLTLTSQQIKALVATPQTFIAAPGAGKVICFASPIWASKVYGGTNVFVAAASQNVGLFYGTTINVLTAGTFPITNAIITTSNSNLTSTPTATFATGTLSSYQNQAVNVRNNVATEITGNAANDNTITFTALYYIATL